MTDSISLSLTGKCALISGGSRGIGAATVRMFVQAGARVAFNFQKARSEAEALVRDLGEAKCVALQADLTGVEAGTRLVEAAVAHLGRVDVLVANHGIWPADELGVDAMPAEHWRRTIATNLDSVFGLVHGAVATMKAQSAGGKIVLVSSTAGQRGEAFHCDYAASKGALISMAKGLSTELARDGIYVNCVAPGWVATDMSAPVLNDEAAKHRVLSTIPLGRMAKPEEIAAAILFLCTEHASFIAGEVLNVNGGAVLVG